jgi:hypothetical protein
MMDEVVDLYAQLIEQNAYRRKRVSHQSMLK